MISRVSVDILTGDDDVRAPSDVWLRVFVSGRTAPYVQEAAMNRRFADRTWTTLIAWARTGRPLGTFSSTTAPVR